MQRLVRVIVLTALATLAVAPAAAAQSRWTVRLSGAWVEPRLDPGVVDSAVPVDAASDGALGGGAGVEYRLRPWLGLGLDVFHARPQVVVAADLPGGQRRVSDNLGFTPLSLGPVLHLTTGRTVDLTVSAVLGLIGYGDLSFAADGAELRLDGGRDVAWGIGAGVDIRPGASRWGIHAGVRRYASDPEFTNRDNGAVGSADMNAVVVTLGVAYRF